MTLFEDKIFWIIVVVALSICLGDMIISDIRKYLKHRNEKHFRR